MYRSEEPKQNIHRRRNELKTLVKDEFLCALCSAITVNHDAHYIILKNKSLSLSLSLLMEKPKKLTWYKNALNDRK